MANQARRRYNFMSGTLTDNPLLIGATTFNSAGLAAFPTVSSTEYAAITISPLSLTPEIVWITAHTFGQTVATIIRGRESTSALQWSSGTRWAHTATTWDYSYLKTPMSRTYARANYR
jgi:hypothetical protein